MFKKKKSITESKLIEQCQQVLETHVVQRVRMKYSLKVVHLVLAIVVIAALVLNGIVFYYKKEKEAGEVAVATEKYEEARDELEEHEELRERMDEDWEEYGYESWLDMVDEYDEKYYKLKEQISDRELDLENEQNDYARFELKERGWSVLTIMIFLLLSFVLLKREIELKHTEGKEKIRIKGSDVFRARSVIAHIRWKLEFQKTLKRMEDFPLDEEKNIVAILGDVSEKRKKGYSVLTNKKIYFGGKYLCRDGKKYQFCEEEREVDLADIKGTRYVKNYLFGVISWLLFPVVVVVSYMEYSDNWFLLHNPTAMVFPISMLAFCALLTDWILVEKGCGIKKSILTFVILASPIAVAWVDIQGKSYKYGYNKDFLLIGLVVSMAYFLLRILHKLTVKNLIVIQLADGAVAFKKSLYRDEEVNAFIKEVKESKNKVLSDGEERA